MKALAPDGTRTATTPRDTSRFLEDLLDELAVTDREYHHLNLSIPLTASIIDAALRTAHPGDRVLLVGGTMLLAEALLRLDFHLDVWRLPQSLLSTQTEPYVSHDVTMESLASCDVPPETYALVILPFIIESMPDNARQLLEHVRRSLLPDGRIIIATRNQARMETRVAAILGMPFASRRRAGSLSLSWPALPVYVEYHRRDLVRLSRDAGLKIDREACIDAQRLFLELEPMPIEAYLMKKGGQAARALAPSLRDTLLFELSSRRGDDGPVPASPHVSVAVSATRGGDRLRAVLSDLQVQTYPKNKYEIVVLHDGGEEVRAIVEAARQDSHVPIREVVGDSADGAVTRNRAMLETEAAIVGHTDDSSALPGDWIEAAVIRFDNDTAAVSGPIFAGPDSHPKYLDVPGSRPDPAERERWRTDLFSIANVFYRTSAARALGGFDVDFSQSRASQPIGWDTDLAWRLQRAGWQSRFCETLVVSTVFRPGDGDPVVGEIRRAEQLPHLYAQVPEVRRQLIGGVFASRQTMYFDLLLAGLSLAAWRRNPVWLVTAVPWLGQVSRRFGVWPPRKWAPSARVVARIAALNVLWLAGFLKGSIRARRLVL